MSNVFKKPTQRSLTNTRSFNMEQRKNVLLKVPEEVRAEKAKKVELFLNRLKVRNSRYESHILRYLDTWCEPKSQFNDDADVSLHPSYNLM
nr:uncharacterized protein LOC108084110 isoform X2 [Drosophila kikkawai]